MSPSRHTATPTPEAPECFAALERASVATKYAVVSTASGRRSSSLTSTETGIGDLPARAERAASRPRSVRMAGWMPRTRSRISERARLASPCASSTSSRAASGSSAIFCFAMPRPIARETRRCWAPSCRSRSILRRSTMAASIALVRLSVRTSTRSASLSLPLGPRSASPRAAWTLTTSRAKTAVAVRATRPTSVTTSASGAVSARKAPVHITPWPSGSVQNHSG